MLEPASLQPLARIRLASGLSGAEDTPRAAEQACERAAANLAQGDAGVPTGSGTDLALVFFSTHHLAQAPAVLGAVHKVLSPRCVVGVSAESVLAGGTELERAPGVAVLAARLPGVTLTPFSGDDLGPHVADGAHAAGGMAHALGVRADLRA